MYSICISCVKESKKAIYSIRFGPQNNDPNDNTRIFFFAFSLWKLAVSIPSFYMDIIKLNHLNTYQKVLFLLTWKIETCEYPQKSQSMKSWWRIFCDILIKTSGDGKNSRIIDFELFVKGVYKVTNS
jgi:hypothetical protein